MKKVKIIGTALSILLLMNQNNLFAFTNKNTQIIDKEKIVKEYKVLDSETNTFVNYIENNIKNGKDVYKYSNYIKVDDNDNIVRKEKQEFYENIEFNNISKIKEVYGEKRNYEDNEYIGVLDNLNIDIEKIDNGTHEEIWEIKEDFKDYSINELDTVPKEIKKYGYTYYLTDCIFNVSKTETIDNTDVPTAYSGTKIYQTIATVKNTDTYNISLTYSGNVERKDKLSLYTVEYNYKYVPFKEIIIISGASVLLIIVYLFFRTNTRIYNYSNGKYKLIKATNLNNRKRIIDITSKSYKIDTNIYKIKVNRSILRKLNNNFIDVKLNNITKKIQINGRETNFKL